MSKENNHIVGYGTYVYIWLTLLALTALTISVSGMQLFGVTLIVAILIAIIKAGLVLNIFMHIKFDNVVFKIFVAIGIITLASIIIFTFTDYMFR
jgi:cytochrome c oxidase subunit 4